MNFGMGMIQDVDFKTSYDSENNVREAISAYLETKPFDFNETKEIAVSDLAKSFTEWAKTTSWTPPSMETLTQIPGQINAGSLYHQSKSREQSCT